MKLKIDKEGGKMKKLILLGMAILSIGAFAAREKVPEDVEKIITKSSQSLDGSER